MAVQMIDVEPSIPVELSGPGDPYGLSVAFIRSGERRHRLAATRSDGLVAMLTFYDYGRVIPHDMAHLVVERMFGLRHGFWGLVAAGTTIDQERRASKAEPSRRNEDPLVAEHQAELSGTEFLVNMFHVQAIEQLEDQDAAYVRAATETFGALGLNLPEHFNWVTIRRLRWELAAVNEAWQEVPPGGTLVIDC